jgi:hypothetical protein
MGHPRYLLRERKLETTGFVAPKPGLGHYAQVYRDAAAQLAGTRTDGGPWALPIIFLYRHAIEAIIKAILTEFGRDAGICPECVLRRSHSLKQQLPDLQTVAKRSQVTLGPLFIQLIEAWEQDDAKGMKARYPLTMGGQEQELPNSDAFDLRSLVDECESALDELSELKADLNFQRYSEILKSEGLDF